MLQLHLLFYLISVQQHSLNLRGMTKSLDVVLSTASWVQMAELCVIHLRRSRRSIENCRSVN